MAQPGLSKYVLKNKKPVPCDDLLEWARQFEDNERRVVNQTRQDGTLVSTVFLGIDHGYGNDVPLLFETMIFGGAHDEYQERCATWTEAEEMHKRACELAGLPPKPSEEP